MAISLTAGFLMQPHDYDGCPFKVCQDAHVVGALPRRKLSEVEVPQREVDYEKASPTIVTALRGIILMLGLGVASIVLAAEASSIVGNWEGTLDPGARPKKRVLVHISSAQDGTLTGTIDYPDQGTSGILITAITYKEPTLHFESNQIKVYMMAL